jgi:hypothetical protein
MKFFKIGAAGPLMIIPRIRMSISFFNMVVTFLLRGAMLMLVCDDSSPRTSRQALGYPHLSSARQSATASVEKFFLLALGTFRVGIMLMNFTDQGLKGVKDVPNGAVPLSLRGTRMLAFWVTPSP